MAKKEDTEDRKPTQEELDAAFVSRISDWNADTIEFIEEDEEEE